MLHIFRIPQHRKYSVYLQWSYVQSTGFSSCSLWAFPPSNTRAASGILYEKEKLSFETVLQACTMGGDTDSNGSMVGSFVGFICGQDSIPSNHKAFLSSEKLLRTHANKFSSFLHNIHNAE